MACSMPDANKFLLGICRPIFVKFIRPRDVLVPFRHILSDLEHERVQCETTTNGDIAGAQHLFNIISRRADWFSLVIHILNNDEVKLQHLANLLKKDKELWQQIPPDRRRFPREYTLTLSSLYIEFNKAMADNIYKLFLAQINPYTVLHVIKKYSDSVLTRTDVGNIRAEITNCGDHHGAQMLFERLILYENWFDVLMDVLRDPGTGLNDVAKAMENATASTRMRYEEEKTRIYWRDSSRHMYDETVQHDQEETFVKVLGPGHIQQELSVLESDGSEMMQTTSQQFHFTTPEESDSARSQVTEAADGNGHFECLRLLIERGCDIKGCDNKSNTALIYAVDNGDNNFVELLINGGADVNFQDQNGNTALMIAILNNNLECVQMLVRENANLTIVNNVGKSPLQFIIGKLLENVIHD